MALERGAEPRLKGGVLAPTLNVGPDGLSDLVANRDAVDARHLPQEILLIRFEPQRPCHPRNGTVQLAKVSRYFGISIPDGALGGWVEARTRDIQLGTVEHSVRRVANSDRVMSGGMGTT